MSKSNIKHLFEVAKQSGCPEFDKGKYRLGDLCSKHPWGGSQQSLRTLEKNVCVLCRSEASSKPRIKRVTVGEDNYLSPRICSRKHTYEDTGMTLRFNVGNACVECQKINRKGYRTRNLEVIRDRDRERYNSDPEYRQKKRNKCSRWKKNNRDKANEMNQRYRNKPGVRDRENARRRELHRLDPEKRGKQNRAWDKANPEKKLLRNNRLRFLYPERYRAYSHKRRARMLSNHQYPYSVEQITQRREEFSNECAYCGVLLDLRSTCLDHFISVSKGGSDVISNIVPSCVRCNCSKNNSEPFEWYQRQEFFLKKRWRRILKVLGKTQSNYLQIPLL